MKMNQVLSVLIFFIFISNNSFSQIENLYRSFKDKNEVKVRTNPVQLNPEWAPFFHGVASGDPSENSIILWTRVTPDSTITGNIEVEWRIANDPELTDVLFSGMVEAMPEDDYTVKIKVEDFYKKILTTTAA